MNEALDLNAIIEFAILKADYDRNVAPTKELRVYPQEIYDMISKFKDRDITGIVMLNGNITELYTKDKVEDDE